MLYLVVTFYHPDYTHNYIKNKGDDGKKHKFIFDITKEQEGLAYLRLDHYDARMYPFGAKEKKIMSYYALFKLDDNGRWDKIVKDFGSDWIGI